MTSDWEKIMTTRLPHQAELAKAKLAEQDINAVVINKQSSAYPVFGNHEVYVPTKDAILARIILDNETTTS
jgi:Putative prokaryotic signal transducing protein